MQSKGFREVTLSRCDVTLSFPGAHVHPLPWWYVQCVFMSVSPWLCVFPLSITRWIHQTPTAMSAHVRNLPSLGGHWLIYKTTSRNPCVLNILFTLSQFPFILLHLNFYTKKLTSKDLLAPMTLLLWLGSAKGRHIMRQQGVREVT